MENRKKSCFTKKFSISGVVHRVSLIIICVCLGIAVGFALCSLILALLKADTGNMSFAFWIYSYIFCCLTVIPSIIAFISGAKEFKKRKTASAWSAVCVIYVLLIYIGGSPYMPQFVIWYALVTAFFVLSIIEAVKSKKTKIDKTADVQEETLTDTESQEKRETLETPQAQESEPQE